MDRLSERQQESYVLLFAMLYSPFWYSCVYRKTGAKLETCTRLELNWFDVSIATAEDELELLYFSSYS